MKAAISVYQDDSIGIITISPRDMADLTGPGGAYSQVWADREIGERTNPAPASAALVLPLALVVEWSSAFVSGGLTEAEATEILQRMSDATIEVTKGLVCKARYHVERELLPKDDSVERHFRAALECPAGAIQVNMPKARIIHMDRIRTVRDAELEKLDVAFMKALEAGNTVGQQEIAAEKQTLRDIPQTFDLSKYRAPATLKAAWPAELPR